jgi:hypothetical protein
MRQMGHQTRAKPRDGLLNCSMQKPDGLAGFHPASRMIRKIGNRSSEKFVRQQEDC